MGLNEDGVTYLVNNFWDKCKKTYVPQIDGKGLSTEDYTTEEKDRLASLNILIGNEELQTTAKTVTSAINEILGASIDGHLLSNITDEDGVHNIRYNNNLLQIKKNDTWKDIPYLTSNVESSLKAKIYLGSGTVIVDSMTGEELYVNDYYIDALGNGSFYSVTQDGNAVLDTVNYTTYCATKDHTHSNYSLTSHTHSNYASSSHTHSNYSLTSHTHSNYASSSHTHSYLPLSGGTISGTLTSTGTITSNTSLHLYTNIGALQAYTTSFAIYSKWRDGSNHDVVTRGTDGLGCALGWAGSASYATIVTIRGRTCKYQNASGTSTLSDRNLKKDFKNLSEAHDIFFDNLNPTTYKYILGTSGRQHFGYITQEVEEALEIAGLTTKDFGGVNITPLTCRETETDEETGESKDIYNSADNYLLDRGIKEQHNLIYTEFVALNTWQIQKLKKRVKEQEERIAKLESLIM